MRNLLTQFATTEGASGDLFSALGIDWKMLVLQIIAFLILVWLLAKFVYPVLIKSVDERQAKIEESTRAADEARVKAEAAEKEVEKLLAQARKDAKGIVATAKAEAVASVEAAEAKATDRAKKIIESAHEQIEKDVIAAKKTLHNETIELVAQATEKVLRQKIDTKADQALVASSVKEVQ